MKNRDVTDMPVVEPGSASSYGAKKSILVLSRELTGNVGGVVSYVKAERHALSENFEFFHMNIGSRIGESFLKKSLRLLKDPISLILALRSGSYDIVQLNPSMKIKPLIRDGVFSWLVNRFCRGKLVVVFHGWSVPVADGIGDRWVAHRLFMSSFGGAKLFVVLSDRFAAKLISLGIPESRVHVLPSMFDDLDFSLFKKRPKSKDKIILFMSRLDRKKGARELIEAFSQDERSAWSEWKLVIAGEGVEWENVTQLVKRLNLEDRISVVGQITGQAKINAFASASIFALPTFDDEGLPISVLEAMAAGCALLTSNAGGLAEAVTDEVHGVVMGSVSAEAIRGGIGRLTCETEFRNQCQRNSHKMAWSQYSSTVIIGTFQQLLEDLD